MSPVAAPLFRDPIYDGAADPTIIWNRRERCWWILYTNRRANVSCEGLAWVHGTDIGVASSSDGGRSWLYRGVVEGLERGHGRNTWWAPEVILYEGLYHMYVSRVSGVPSSWAWPRDIFHYTSRDLWRWEPAGRVELSSPRVIDACLYRMPGGSWRMWYKDEDHQSQTWAAESADLFRWSVVGPVITGRGHEGPNVFRWRGAYWMVVDEWRGQSVYRSADLLAWQPQGLILDIPGRRPEDGSIGHHADVLVIGERAIIFYFTHPGRRCPDAPDCYETRRTSLQAAELGLREGRLVCDRDAPFELDLPTEESALLDPG